MGTSVPRRRTADVALFLGVVLLYALTYGSVPTSDGYTWIRAVDEADPHLLLLAHHPLATWTVYALKARLAALGVAAPALLLFQAVNALAAGWIAVLLASIIRALGGTALLGGLTGLVFAASFGSWYFANGEIHHLSLLVLVGIFARVVHARATGVELRPSSVAWLGLLNALAVLLHQENFLFGFAPLAALAVGRPWSAGLRDAVAYVTAGAAATAVLAGMVGVGLHGLSSAPEIVRWYFWLLDYVQAPREYLDFERAGTLYALPRTLKGQLTALVYGTHVLTDVVKEPPLLRHATVSVLAALTLVAYALLGWLAVLLWRERGRLGPARMATLAGAATWVLAYKVLLHWWYWPTSTEYHLVTVPPLVLLLALGPAIAVGPRRVVATAGVAALAALLLVVNGWGAIAPWHRYGRMKDGVEARMREIARPGDLVMSSESGLDPVLHRGRPSVKVKSVLHEAPKAEGFARLRAAVAARVADGHRVFVYNEVPAAFTLISLNQSAARRGRAPVTARDFEDFAAELRRRYVVVPVLEYWEESKEPLYLFGRRAETVWAITGPR